MKRSDKKRSSIFISSFKLPSCNRQFFFSFFLFSPFSPPPPPPSRSQLGSERIRKTFFCAAPHPRLLYGPTHRRVRTVRFARPPFSHSRLSSHSVQFLSLEVSPRSNHRELDYIDPTSVTTAAAPHYPHPPQSEGRPNPQYSHTPQPEARPANISSSNTPQPEYGLNPPPARSPAYHQDYLPRPPSFAPNSQPGGAPGMAQATSPFQPTPSAITTSSASPVPMTSSHSVAPGSLPASDSIATPRSPDPEPEATLASLPASHNFTSDAPIPLDPSLPANSPTYPPPYSPYQPQGHEMAQYQGHPPPPHQMYARPDWGHGYGQQHHGLPGPYASPAATTVSSPSSVATGGSRTGQVCFW